MQSLERAYDSLVGLWVGDAFGGHFEFESVDWNRPQRAYETQELPPATWRYTDDTQMAISVYDILRQCGEIQPDKLAESFAENFDISRGYGIGTEQLILDMQSGGDWTQLAPARFDGEGSRGNGSAMRATPIGAYFADDVTAVVENAKLSSIVTHTHADAIAGTIAVALASSQASLFSANNSVPEREIYWQTIIDHTPSGALRDKVEQAARLNAQLTSPQVAKILGCGWDVSAIDTVPFALWSAISYMESFEDAMWQTIRVGGDADTTGAIVGGIVAAYVGRDNIPLTWKVRCESLSVDTI